MRFVAATVFVLLLALLGGAIGVLFGPRSAFGSTRGFGSWGNMRRIHLLTTDTLACVSRSRANLTDQALEPAPVRQGGLLVEGPYGPVLSSKRNLPPAPSTVDRLTLCVLLGVGAAAAAHIAAVTEPAAPRRTGWTVCSVAKVAGMAGAPKAVLQAIANRLLRACIGAASSPAPRSERTRCAARAFGSARASASVSGRASIAPPRPPRPATRRTGGSWH